MSRFHLEKYMILPTIFRGLPEKRGHRHSVGLETAK